MLLMDSHCSACNCAKQMDMMLRGPVMVPSALQISMCTALWHLGQDRCCFVHIVCPAVSLSWPYTNGMLSDLVYSNTFACWQGPQH